jgi:hypothetical protein
MGGSVLRRGTAIGAVHSPKDSRAALFLNDGVLWPSSFGAGVGLEERPSPALRT